MGKIFRPRRGKNSTAKAQLKTGALGPLANGEVFFELPNGGAGTGEGKIIMGDGRTAYEQLPTFIDPSKYVHKGDTENQTVSFTETSSTDNAALLKNITSGASLKNLFSPVKNLLSNLNSSVTKLNNDLLDKIYPVGAVYISVNDVNPSTLFGGTWERIEQGRFLISSGDNYKIGTTGGEATHTLSTDEIPSHNHGSVNISGNFYSVIGQRNSGADGCFGWSSYNSYGEMNSGSGSYAKCAGALSLNSTHTHESVGGGAAHNNIPPYLSVNVWKRTK